MRQLSFAIAICAAALAWAGTASAELLELMPVSDTTPIEGQPRILNTSSLAIDDKRIVLFGVDPMMKSNPCSYDNRAWDCGTAALRILMNMLGREPVTCEPRATDLFRRIYARCLVHGQDIALALVEAGMAVTVPEETKEYEAAQEEAMKKKVGIWRGRFIKPADYRTMMSGEPQSR